MSGTREKQQPESLEDAVRYFADPEVANEYAASLRWPGGRVCPRCGSAEHSYISTRRLWSCKACKRQFSVKAGTAFEGSTLGLDKWLPAVWVVANSMSEVSTRELARVLGVTQKSAWFMLRRIRLAMEGEPPGR
ncbi:MAG TPA: IS1595 family transposase [Gaiellaceae bacterium]|nr:IS1595 family transposase [Gaiellaceae bacterium]